MGRGFDELNHALIVVEVVMSKKIAGIDLGTTSSLAAVQDDGEPAVISKADAVSPPNVTPLSLGIETFGGEMATLIPRNTEIPTHTSEVFSTAADAQTTVEILVMQGERPIAADNVTLGTFRLEDIPSSPRGTRQIEVTLDVDANGILSATAKDQASGREQNITIKGGTGLNDADVEGVVQDAQRSASDDNLHQETIHARNQADRAIYDAEQTLLNLGEKVFALDRSQIAAQVNTLKQAMSGEDAELIGAQIADLQHLMMVLNQSLYRDAPTGPGGNNPTALPHDHAVESPHQEV
jgi:molecular chaperone DnaK